MFKLCPESILVTSEYQKLAQALQARFRRRYSAGKEVPHACLSQLFTFVPSIKNSLTMSK